MIKKLLLGSISILVTLSMVACGSYDTTKHLEEKIVVYTTYSDDVMDYIAKTFTEETGVEIEYKVIQGNIEESIANNSEVDFLLGGDISTYDNLSKNGLLRSFKTSWFNEIDESNRQENGEWYAVSKDMILLVYNNKNLLPQNAPKSWGELANNAFRDKITMEGTDNEYMKVLLSSVMYQYYKNNEENVGLDYYQKVKNNIVSFAESKESLFEALRAKETPIGICTLSDYIKYSQPGDTIIVIKPEDGIPSITQGAAILKNAPHPNASELFMEFVAGPRIQLELAQKNSIIPTYSEAMKYGPDWMSSLAELVPMEVDWSVVQANKKRWIDSFNSMQKEIVTSVKTKTTNKVNKAPVVQQTNEELESGEENDTPPME